VLNQLSSSSENVAPRLNHSTSVAETIIAAARTSRTTSSGRLRPSAMYLFTLTAIVSGSATAGGSGIAPDLL
jgi:hypothetical protein